MNRRASRYDIVTFGEGLIRLSPSRYERLEQATMFDVYAAGSELEVAAGASRLGLRTAWLSKLTDNPLGRKITNKAREHGVDTSGVCWVRDGRVGFFYVEPGSAPRATQVIDDRDRSAFSGVRSGEIDWSFLRESRLFHVGGTVPTLGPACADVTAEGVRAARQAGCLISVSLDVPVDAVPDGQHPIPPLLEYADLLVITEAAAQLLFDVTGPAETVVTALQARSGARVVALAAGRLRTPRSGTWTGVVAADTVYQDRPYDLEVIDASGTLSAFTAGFLYGYLTDGPEKGLRYGNAAAALTHSIPGNLTWVGEEEILGQLQGEGGKLQR
ncbi:MAG: sugar kinase [Candidatus Latescibacteria bacterium]|nr:sugar kinase [Candidatus Latescibacterota bacterium]